jgi:hypothetical protein
MAENGRFSGTGRGGTRRASIKIVDLHSHHMCGKERLMIQTIIYN